MRSKLKIITLNLILFAFLACKAEQERPLTTNPANPDSFIQIIGSDTMVNLVQAWAEAFALTHPHVNISIRGGGSGTGIAAFLNHSCQIAMSSRPISLNELNEAKQAGIEPMEYKVALDGLIVIVNPQNKLYGVTLDQLRDIFLGRINSWEELNSSGGRIVILSRESNSGTYLFFKEHILQRGNKKNRDEFSPHALLMPSSQAIVNEVRQNPHAIGYVGLGYLAPYLKALAIARDLESPYIMPSIESVADNSYPISRPLFFYIDNKPTGLIKEFIDFVLSAEGQRIVTQTDFVPVKPYEENN